MSIKNIVVDAEMSAHIHTGLHDDSTPEAIETTEMGARIFAGFQAALQSPTFIRQLTDIVYQTINHEIKPLQTKLRETQSKLAELEPLIEKMAFVENKLEPLLSRIEELEAQILKSNQELKDEKTRSHDSESMLHSGKGNNLILSGLPTPSDSTPAEFITNLADVMNIRIGPFSTKTIGRNNSILIHFESVWDKRKLYAARLKLKDHGFENLFISEDLLKTQSEIFFHCRQARKMNLVQSTWSFNGSVYLKQAEGGGLIVSSLERLHTLVPLYTPKAPSTSTDL
jgi:hypothetical protein